MATKYARAGGGNWNANSTWSTTSGGAADTVVPTNADDVFLDASSGAVTINVSGQVCRSLNCTGYTSTLTHSAFSLSIGDATAGASNIALKLVAGMTYTPASNSSSFIFSSTSSTVQTVDCGGQTVGNLNFSAVGKWALISNVTMLNTTSQITPSNGTLQFDGTSDNSGLSHTFGTLVGGNNTNTRVWTLGTCTITLTGGSGNTFFVQNSTNFTFSAGSSTINFTGAGQTTTISVGGSAGNGVTFGTVNITGSGFHGLNAPNKTCTFGTLTRTTPASKLAGLNISSTLVVTGTLSLNGNSAINRCLIQSNTFGTQRTFSITGATVTATNTDFRDIRMSATTIDFSAQTDIGDAGGNTGITFPASVTQTWNGTTGGDWSANAWTTRIPLPQDDVVISSAFSSGQTITADMPRLGRSIDFSGMSWSGTATEFAINSIANTIYGSLTLKSGMTFTTGQTPIFEGRSSFNLTSAGNSFASFSMSMIGGTLTLLDAYSGSGTFTLNNGTLDADLYNFTTSIFDSDGSGTRAIIMGTGTWTLTGIGNIWTTAASLSVTAEQSTILISNTSGSAKTFAGSSKIYNNLTITGGGAGTVDFTGNTNTFNTFTINSPKTVRFTAGTTTTVSDFIAVGTSGNLITIRSLTAATHTLSKASGTVDANYLHLTNSIATGGATWYAGADSTDNGGNTGWIFATFQETVLDAALSLLAPTVVIDHTFLATELDLTAALQDPLTLIDVTISPSILEVVSDVQDITFSIDSSVFPDVLDVSLTLQDPTILIDTLVLADPIDIVSDVQDPSFSLGMTVTPVVLSLSSELLDPSITADVIVLPNTQDVTASVLSPNNLIDVTVTPGTLDLVLELQNPTTETATVVAVEVLDLISSVLNPNIQIDTTVQAELLTLLSEVLDPRVVNIKGIKISLDIKRNHILTVKIIQEIYRNVDIKRTITRNFKRG